MLSHTETFVERLTACQPQLRVLVELLLGDHTAANDVLQETNLLLWRKASEFVEGTDFAAWAASVARFKVLSYLRDAGRDRLVVDAELVEQLADYADRLLTSHDARQEALRHCLEKLSPSQRELVSKRYYRDQSLDQLAQDVGRSQAGVQMALSRIRHLLFDCIRERIAAEGI